MRTPRRCAALGAEPETEHDRHVCEQREGVPVADGLAKPRDAIAFGIERGNRFRHQRPDEHGGEHDAENPCRQSRRDLPPDRRQREPEREERRVGHRLVERVPAAIGHDRPGHARAGPQDEADRRSGQQRAPAAHPGERESTEGDRDQARDDHADGEATDRKNGVVVRSVTCEGRAQERRANESREDEGTDPGRPEGRLRRPVHGGPR